MDPLQQFKAHLVGHADEIVETSKMWNAPMAKITIITRDPDKPNMHNILTNDNLDEVIALLEKEKGENNEKV